MSPSGPVEKGGHPSYRNTLIGEGIFLYTVLEIICHELYTCKYRVPTLTGKVWEFGLRFSRSGTVLEFHRNRENPGKNREFYRRSRFIWVHRSFVVPNLFGY